MKVQSVKWSKKKVYEKEKLDTVVQNTNEIGALVIIFLKPFRLIKEISKYNIK